jgi:WD40 repeat protein
VVSASADQTFKVWDLDNGRLLAAFEGHSDWVNACVVTPDDRRLVSASRDRTLKVWDLDSGRILATFEGHTDWVNDCAMTPDGQRVVSASRDQTLKVWDLDSGRVPPPSKATPVVNACTVTPDGQRVVPRPVTRRSRSGTSTGRALATFEGHADSVSDCAVTPNSQRGSRRLAWSEGLGSHAATSSHLRGHVDRWPGMRRDARRPARDPGLMTDLEGLGHRPCHVLAIVEGHPNG